MTLLRISIKVHSWRCSTKLWTLPALQTVDISSAVSELLACKDPEEIKKAKRAAYLAATALQKYAVPQFESEALQ